MKKIRMGIFFGLLIVLTSWSEALGYSDIEKGNNDLWSTGKFGVWTAAIGDKVYSLGSDGATSLNIQYYEQNGEWSPFYFCCDFYEVTGDKDHENPPVWTTGTTNLGDIVMGVDYGNNNFKMFRINTKGELLASSSGEGVGPMTSIGSMMYIFIDNTEIQMCQGFTMENGGTCVPGIDAGCNKNLKYGQATCFYNFAKNCYDVALGVFNSTTQKTMLYHYRQQTDGTLKLIETITTDLPKPVGQPSPSTSSVAVGYGSSGEHDNGTRPNCPEIVVYSFGTYNNYINGCSYIINDDGTLKENGTSWCESTDCNKSYISSHNVSTTTTSNGKILNTTMRTSYLTFSNGGNSYGENVFITVNYQEPVQNDFQMSNPLHIRLCTPLLVITGLPPHESLYLTDMKGDSTDGIDMITIGVGSSESESDETSYKTDTSGCYKFITAEVETDYSVSSETTIKKLYDYKFYAALDPEAQDEFSIKIEDKGKIGWIVYSAPQHVLTYYPESINYAGGGEFYSYGDIPYPANTKNIVIASGGEQIFRSMKYDITQPEYNTLKDQPLTEGIETLPSCSDTTAWAKPSESDDFFVLNNINSEDITQVTLDNASSSVLLEFDSSNSKSMSVSVSAGFKFEKGSCEGSSTFTYTTKTAYTNDKTLGFTIGYDKNKLDTIYKPKWYDIFHKLTDEYTIQAFLINPVNTPIKDCWWVSDFYKTAGAKPMCITYQYVPND